ncbi:electron transfer flavoprotein subunit alpha/FixB family protein [Vibrio hangzhouensis]|uniref:Electron transfer flavoprotein subunit alpha n=1 Tax=Vibrio hangzhouensis TaxID=462991 RepID=A0A1H5RZQ1_9VIBR|nr:FAD-binding protein [Vibrio hangzhouensis]SEF43158.1 electron transfer flavoprotein alpha subunit apoprotein [Vibrio hangzhouensis]
MDTRILVIAEHDNEKVSLDTYKTLSAASCLGDDVAVLVMGSACHNVADTLAKAQYVSKVLIAENEQFAHLLAESCAPLVLRLAKDFSHILAPASTFGKNLLPRVAALLDVGQLSDVIQIVSTDTVIRPIYAGNALATVTTTDLHKVMTIRSSAFECGETDCGKVAEVIEMKESVNNALSKYVSTQKNKSERPELSAARVVVSGGRGLGSKENFAMVEKLADKLGGAIGASRAAVDAGFVSNDLQVGQTGKIVAPELYIAVGISGAIQHMAGMKDSKVIVAINSDPDAPIFQVADYGLVGDLFEVMPELIDKLP